MKENRVLKLLFTFLKIGAFTFGGGYAMIPVIQREIVQKNKWITEDDILDIIAIAESTPGPIAINSATFVGYRVAGVLGSAVATFGVVFPAFMFIYIISFFLRQFEDLQVIKYAFMGIRAGVLSLLINALISMGKKELSKLIEEDKKAEVNCQFCGNIYAFTEDDLIKLLK